MQITNRYIYRGYALGEIVEYLGVKTRIIGFDTSENEEEFIMLKSTYDSEYPAIKSSEVKILLEGYENSSFLWTQSNLIKKVSTNIAVAEKTYSHFIHLLETLYQVNPLFSYDEIMDKIRYTVDAVIAILIKHLGLEDNDDSYNYIHECLSNGYLFTEMLQKWGDKFEN